MSAIAPSYEHVRTVRLSPYRAGQGPTFTLSLWDTNSRVNTGLQHRLRQRLAYRLTMREPGKRPVVLFEGADYGCSPTHAIDSDAAVYSCLVFLTLRPGDTDAEYFEKYSAEQMAFCTSHAESLSYEAMNRFDKSEV